MTPVRASLGLAALALATLVAACSGGYGPSTTTTAPLTSATAATTFTGTTYLALGDGATVAIGSTACGTTPSVNCPTNTSATAGTNQMTNGVAVPCGAAGGPCPPQVFFAPGAFSGDHFHYSDAGYRAVDAAAFAAFSAFYPIF